MLLASSGYLVLVVVFATSGTIKLRRPRVFARQAGGYGLVPRALAMHVAVAVAVTETGCAVLLVPPRTRLSGLVIAGCLVGAFLAVMSLAVVRGQRIPCACFGGTGDLDTVGLPSLLRTALLGVIVLASLPERATVTRPVQALVAALVLVLVFLLAETSRLLPGWRRPASATGQRGWRT
jgi:uncharacterized membrane protein YphA (DoxX/SURF4 family)